jgi:hypothetical protein
MCTNRACYDGDCYACQQIDRLTDHDVGTDGKPLCKTSFYFTGFSEQKVQEKTEERKAQDLSFFEEQIKKVKILGMEAREYRNKLYNNKEIKDGITNRSAKFNTEKQLVYVQRDADFKREKNVSVERNCIWRQWGGQNNSAFLREESNHYGHGREL